MGQGKCGWFLPYAPRDSRLGVVSGCWGLPVTLGYAPCAAAGMGGGPQTDPLGE